MATHVVRSAISFPFKMRVDIESPPTSRSTTSSLWTTRTAIVISVALPATNYLTPRSDHDGTVAISSVTEGSVWIDEGLPTKGVTDGKGGVIWGD